MVWLVHGLVRAREEFVWTSILYNQKQEQDDKLCVRPLIYVGSRVEGMLGVVQGVRTVLFLENYPFHGI